MDELHDLEVLEDRLGKPPSPLGAVFPLSPSAVGFGFFGQRCKGGGCPLIRVLGKCYGWRSRASEYVAAGDLFDAVVTTALSRMALGMDPGDIEPAILLLKETFELRRPGYDLASFHQPVESFLEQLEGMLRANWEVVCSWKPIEVQKKHLLYIGSSPRPEFVPDRDLVLGFSDFIEEMPGGEAVRDVKLLSPSTRVRQNSRKYALQLGTYATERSQAGKSVVQTSIEQFIKKEFKHDPIWWPWTSVCGERIIACYQGVRDSFRVGLSGRFNFVRPLKGTGVCTPFGCDFFGACPFGRGLSSEREKLESRVNH